MITVGELKYVFFTNLYNQFHLRCKLHIVSTTIKQFSPFSSLVLCFTSTYQSYPHSLFQDAPNL